MNPQRIECRDCHHALKLQSNDMYAHSGPRGRDCPCTCQNATLDRITYFVPKHMQREEGQRGRPRKDAAAVPAGVAASSPAPANNGTAVGVPSTPAPVGGDTDTRPVEGASIGDAGSTPSGPGPYDHLKQFSNSELTTFRRCKRKWWLVFHRRLKLKYEDPSGVRGLGTRLHLALAAYYSRSLTDPMQTLLDSFKEDIERLELLGQDPKCNLDIGGLIAEMRKDQEYGVAMLEGYFDWLRETGADADLEILSNEMQVTVPILNGQYALTGKLDVRLRRRQDMARLFMDHKSVGNFKEPARTLHMDTQMMHYHLLEYLTFLELGYEPKDVEAQRTDGGLYNMLRRVKRTAAANPPFYDRLEVRHSVHELRSYFLRVTGEVKDIVALEQRLLAGEDHRYVAYPTPKRDCTWDCDFLLICPMFDDNSRVEDLINEYYEQHDPMERYRSAKDG